MQHQGREIHIDRHKDIKFQKFVSKNCFIREHIILIIYLPHISRGSEYSRM